ncbi:MAG: hypothetical protein JSU89_04180, partial [Myxococcales bacterium]
SAGLLGKGFPVFQDRQLSEVHGSANNLLRQVASAEVTRAITGHSTSALTCHYSHVGVEEKNQAMPQVWKLVVGGDKIVGDRVGSGDLPDNVVPIRPRNS